MKVEGLKNQIGVDGPRPFLLCSVCGQEASANAGDYFAASPDYEFICCGAFMLLVTKEVRYNEATA